VQSLNAFIMQVMGQVIQAPYGLGGQCVDLANLYILRCYNLPHVYRNAVDWATVHIPGFEWEPNGPSNAPGLGSLVVWGSSAAAGTGANGHIALGIEGDASLFLSVDQNWGPIVACRFVMHSYVGVLGWHKPVK
jgi:hypothetical protein